MASGPRVRLAAAVGFEFRELVGPAGRLERRRPPVVGSRGLRPRVRMIPCTFDRSAAWDGPWPWPVKPGELETSVAGPSTWPATSTTTASLVHVLATSLWHGATPDVAHTQLERATEACYLTKAAARLREPRDGRQLPGDGLLLVGSTR